MPTVTDIDVAGMMEQLQHQMAEISSRMQALEQLKTEPLKTEQLKTEQRKLANSVTPEASPLQAKPVDAVISEEEVLAIAAAIGAYLGVRAHIRQIRLVSSNAWAQQGRVSIQASHSLQG